MLVDYRLEYPRKSRIGDSSFRAIVKTTTNEDMKAKTAVDYVAGVSL